MTFRLPPELNVCLEELQGKFGGTKGELLRHLIRRAYERFRATPAK